MINIIKIINKKGHTVYISKVIWLEEEKEREKVRFKSKYIESKRGKRVIVQQ